MILSVAAGLGLVIFVHELGHFLAAKACGVKVEKFYIGFDIPMGTLPAALLRFRWGETEYGIGILPLGGYVKMLGQDDNPKNQAKENERIKVRKADRTPRDRIAGDGAMNPARAWNGPRDARFVLDPRSYPAKPVWQRMIIISAGVIMNLIFAVIFAAIAYSQGVSYMPCLLGGTAPGDPAWVAGLAGRRQDFAGRPRGTAGRAIAIRQGLDDRRHAERPQASAGSADPACGPNGAGMDLADPHRPLGGLGSACHLGRPSRGDHDRGEVGTRRFGGQPGRRLQRTAAQATRSSRSMASRCRAIRKRG